MPNLGLKGFRVIISNKNLPPVEKIRLVYSENLQGIP